MKKFTLLLSLIFPFFVFFSLGSFWLFNFNLLFSHSKKIRKDIPRIKSINGKKRIKILTCDGGGGHAAATKALESYLGDKYIIEPVNVFTTILGKMDPINKITAGICTGEDVYNSLLKTGNAFLASEFKNFGAKRAIASSKKIENLVYDYLVSEQPDAIISVIPLINAPILNAAKRMNIPFLIVTNDLDTSNYANGFQNIDYDKFGYTLAFPEKRMLDKISKAKIPHNKLTTVGFPIREHFFEEKNVENIKKSIGIPLSKKVVMVMMGGGGSVSTLRYARRLSQMNSPLHLIVCAGKNIEMQKKLNNIKLNKNISITILGFTEKISDYMAVSDLLITKPGPNSICEALQMNLPILVDCTKRVLYWEKYNVEFVKNNGFGEQIKHYYEVEPLIKKYLFDPLVYAKAKLSISSYNKPIFKDNIRALVDNMLKAA